VGKASMPKTILKMTKLRATHSGGPNGLKKTQRMEKLKQG